MNAKKSWIIFAIYAVWLAIIILTFAHASKTVDVNVTHGVIWFAVSLLVACAGIFVAIRLNRKK